MTARKRAVPPVVQARMHTPWRIHAAIHYLAWHAEQLNASYYDPAVDRSRDFAWLIRHLERAAPA